MRILEINSVCGTGSTGRIACQIADIVVKNNGEATVAYGRKYYAEGCNVPTYRIGSGVDTIYHVGKSRITDRQGFYSKKATLKLVTFIEKFCPDIIHLHNIHGYFLNIPILFQFLEFYDKPVVWTFHDCWPFTGHCAHFEFVGCNKWKTGCYQCPQKKVYPASYCLDQSTRNWIEKKKLFTSIHKMTIVTPSQWLANLVKQSFLREYPIKVIPNGIDLKLFKPIRSNWKETYNVKKPIVMACAAIWNERKGFNDVLELATLLPEYQIVIVGVSKKQISNLSNDVIGIQRTDSINELAKIYSVADVFINPTYEDNFPTTNLEALACGTPVITYNTGGSPECIHHDCGLVIEKGDLLGLAKGIRQVIQASLFSGKTCSNRAKRYEKEKQFLKYIRLLESMMIENTNLN